MLCAAASLLALMCLCPPSISARGEGSTPPVRLLRDLFQSNIAWPRTASTGKFDVAIDGETCLLDILDTAGQRSTVPREINT